MGEVCNQSIGLTKNSIFLSQQSLSRDFLYIFYDDYIATYRGDMGNGHWP